ncbi:hypothetical protein MycrhDRAFT_6705 [Mycolicibacterium rhodesiae JS60]|nr:hypothetical protein MycrhDRAFT_6705 [Mycolicibacterium rhodesiae JS60]
MDPKSAELQAEIDRIAAQLGIGPMAVGLLTNDGLNIFVDDDGLYHFAFYERGQLVFDRTGSLDDALYWYCEDRVTDDAARWSDRKQMFQYEYDMLSRFNPEWAKRNVRETAAMFRRNHPNEPRPEGISLLPDIGEAL